jgi:tRNA(Phe) wybutosine-synthesizing methylase Tyw3
MNTIATKTSKLNRNAQAGRSVKTASKVRGLGIRAGIRAGGIQAINHSRALKTASKVRGLGIRAGIRAGGIQAINHSRALASIV